MAFNVMIVDDSATARMFIHKCLRIAGLKTAEFVEAANGQQALEIAKEKSMDLIFTDLTMPEMDGEALLKFLKASPSLNEVPVLIITSNHNDAKEKDLMKKGAAAVVKKPVSPAKLSSYLKKLNLV